MIDYPVRFKSTPENWEKERSGVKPCTIRKKDLTDDRHQKLGAMMAAEDYGKVVMENAEDGRIFVRQITDVTEWEGWLIISWGRRVRKEQLSGVKR